MVERQRGSQDCADRGNAMARSASLTVSASVTRLALGFVATIGFDVCCLSLERASARRWIRAQPDRHLPDRPCLVGARYGDVSWCPDGLAQPAQVETPALFDDTIGGQQQRLRDLDPHCF